MNIIVKGVFGSHLYGTETETSDRDYKGIYIPSMKDLVFMRSKKCLELGTNVDSHEKNTAEDIDFQVFSAQYFATLCGRGDMVAFDLLHAPDKFIVEGVDDPLWRWLRENRSMFYSKNLVGYLGYIAKQVNKYGHKGSRVKALEDITDLLNKFGPLMDNKVKFGAVWDEVLELEEAKVASKDHNGVMVEYINYCGKWFDRNTPLRVVRECFDNEYAKVGQRAIDARNNENVDWKAVSHAVRACLQVDELLETGDIVFPLRKADVVLKIKKGLRDYQEVSQMLEELQAMVFDKLTAKDWPAEPDLSEFEDFLMEYYFSYLGK